MVMDTGTSMLAVAKALHLKSICLPGARAAPGGKGCSWAREPCQVHLGCGRT